MPAAVEKTMAKKCCGTKLKVYTRPKLRKTSKNGAKLKAKGQYPPKYKVYTRSSKPKKKTK